MDEPGSDWSVNDPRMLERLTIRPAGAFRTSGSSVFVSATGAKKFTSKVSCRIADEIVLVRFTRASAEEFSPSIKTAALLIRMSSLPYLRSK